MENKTYKLLFKILIIRVQRKHIQKQPLNHQKCLSQTNTYNTNQQLTEQQRASPQRNQEENNQITIFVHGTENPDDTPSEDQNFLFQSHNQTD